MVAHPDDCIIFAYSYIYNHADMDWTIVYLTYTENDVRGRELAEFWGRRDIPCQFLGYVDDYRDIENNRISFNEQAARGQIREHCDRYDVVLSHDEHGDYGHIHHKFVHDCVKHHGRLITFARLGEGVEYSVPRDAYSLDELPHHKEVIRGFHAHQHRNFYKEPA